jgi:hypothetical protein
LYAAASVEVENPAQGAIELGEVPEQWRAGVLFGILLLREALWQSPDLRTAAIKVRVFRGQPSDTTMMAAAFVAFHSVAQALSVDVGKLFVLDEATGGFSVASSTNEHWS